MKPNVHNFLFPPLITEVQMTALESNSQKTIDSLQSSQPVAVRCWMMIDCGTLKHVTNSILFIALQEVQWNTGKHA